jgi:hypothetical protein
MFILKFPTKSNNILEFSTSIRVLFFDGEFLPIFYLLQKPTASFLNFQFEAPDTFDSNGRYYQSSIIKGHSMFQR